MAGTASHRHARRRAARADRVVVLAQPRRDGDAGAGARLSRRERAHGLRRELPAGPQPVPRPGHRARRRAPARPGVDPGRGPDLRGVDRAAGRVSRASLRCYLGLLGSGTLEEAVQETLLVQAIATAMVVVGATFLVALIWWIERRIERRRAAQLAGEPAPAGFGTCGSVAGAWPGPAPGRPGGAALGGAVDRGRRGVHRGCAAGHADRARPTRQTYTVRSRRPRAPPPSPEALAASSRPRRIVGARRGRRRCRRPHRRSNPHRPQPPRSCRSRPPRPVPACSSGSRAALDDRHAGRRIGTDHARELRAAAAALARANGSAVIAPATRRSGPDPWPRKPSRSSRTPACRPRWKNARA